MKIILEGPDNAGKTTLAKVIRGNASYHHPGGRPEGEVAERKCLTDQLEMVHAFDNILLDRVTAISQRVYNPDPKMDSVRLTYLKQMVKAGAVIVYCRPGNDKLMSFENFTWRDEETEEHKQKIIQGQQRFIQSYDDIMLTVPHVHYDYENEVASLMLSQQAMLGLQGNRAAEQWFHNIISFKWTSDEYSKW